MRTGRTVVNPMPLFHVGGCGLFTLGPVQAPARTCSCRVLDPALALELIETYRGTCWAACRPC